MRSLRLRTLGLALLLLPTGCARAAPTATAAARAVAEAEAMPPGHYRDVTLREVSRNLRHADRARAIAAAAAMSDDRELRSFGPERPPGPASVAPDEASECDRFVAALAPGRASAADDRRIRACFAMDAPPAIVPSPLPPFRSLLAAADALPSGPTKAELLYMATWDAVPDRPAGGARGAVRRLRALVPQLDADTRRQAAGWLDTIAVDLIEQRPDDAIARVRRGLARRASRATGLAEDPATQAQGLIADFLRAGDVARAVTVTDLLSPSDDCTAIDDGLSGVVAFVLPQQDGGAVRDYLTRLDASGSLARLCPKGLDGAFAADAWLRAGDDVRALAAATRAGPAAVAQVRLGIVERRVRASDMAAARAMAAEAAATMPALNAGAPSDRAAAARTRIGLIHQLTRLGDTGAAERLAAGFPGPGWRAFAWSVIVATANDARGPNLDLPELPVDR